MEFLEKTHKVKSLNILRILITKKWTRAEKEQSETKHQANE
jgi:hypothetical protein